VIRRLEQRNTVRVRIAARCAGERLEHELSIELSHSVAMAIGAGVDQSSRAGRARDAVGGYGSRRGAHEL